MVFHNPSGIAVEPPPRVQQRPARLTREQIQRIRFEDWRRQHEDGVPGPDLVVRRRSLREISRISAHPLRTVRGGIAAARRLREAIRDACADDLDLR